MIHYQEPIFRPPSEARSLILQATIGCSHNNCAFCVAYQSKRFKVRPEAELFAEIDWAGVEMPFVRKVFLADGDALVLSTRRLGRILQRLYEKLPNLQRVTLYGSPQNLNKKSVADLEKLKSQGLSMIYLGVESGDDEVLEACGKKCNSEQMIAAGIKPMRAGIDLSVTVILGLAGPILSERHAIQTARVIDEIKPTYASALTLMLAPRNPSFEKAYKDPNWEMLTTEQALAECRTLIANINADGIIFRSNHASNYLALAGDLQKDKAKLLNQIDQVLKNPKGKTRPDFLRGL